VAKQGLLKSNSVPSKRAGRATSAVRLLPPKMMVPFVVRLPPLRPASAALAVPRHHAGGCQSCRKRREGQVRRAQVRSTADHGIFAHH
jgi:hypothetical protein